MKKITATAGFGEYEPVSALLTTNFRIYSFLSFKKG